MLAPAEVDSGFPDMNYEDQSREKSNLRSKIYLSQQDSTEIGDCCRVVKRQYSNGVGGGGDRHFNA